MRSIVNETNVSAKLARLDHLSQSAAAIAHGDKLGDKLDLHCM